jgi:hypothetical protein
MKKIFAVIVLFSLSLILCSCKSEELKNAEHLIEALSTISVDDEAQIIAAENAYNILNERDREKVENHALILEARENFEQWVVDREMADTIISNIDGIGTVSLLSYQAVRDARTAYENLSEAQKIMVENYEILLSAENEYQIVANEAIEGVVSLIRDIGSVSLDSHSEIDVATRAYNALPDNLKNQVENYESLEMATTTFSQLRADSVANMINAISDSSQADAIREANDAYMLLSVQERQLVANASTLSQLKIDNTISLINAIGTVRLISGDAISAAENAYNRLSNTEKPLVSNSSILTEHRNTYDNLVAREEARSIIRVSRVWVSRPDSAGGVELYINWVNNSDKAINYVYFGVRFLNAVGDAVTCTIKRDWVNNCSATGPFARGQGMSGTGRYWGKYYNWNIQTAELVSLEIRYADGSRVTLTPAQLELVQY